MAPSRFNRDIRPIMSDTCFRCHGPDQARAHGGHASRPSATKPSSPTASGAIPIVPGDPDKSAIIQRIFAPTRRDACRRSTRTRMLTAAQKDTIRRWVAEGAVYEGHWAYQPVKRPPVPDVPDAKAPIRNPIDNFIQARLAREQLTPSPEADRRTLIRRVTLDLTGLPPTPARNATPSSTTARRTLTKSWWTACSPRRATPKCAPCTGWTRCAIADTAGFHGDNIWPAWPYRDYVLRAFRDNMPFDQFTREQLAGDLMPNATPSRKSPRPTTA